MRRPGYIQGIHEIMRMIRCMNILHHLFNEVHARQIKFSLMQKEAHDR
jgi:hypothetical protein